MEKITLDKAKREEVEKILELYNELLDSMEEDINYPKWTKGLYPNLDYLIQMQENGCLYVAKQDNKIISSMILNNNMIEDYNKVPWSKILPKEKIMTIHTYMVSDKLRGQGLGLKVLELVKKLAIKEGIEAIRIDTIKGNEPAVKLYERAGFTNLGMHELHYEETDERFFTMFEYNLEENNG